ncbi:hypothetical protein CDL12_19100 [Handroanthus impetiginosus]|uniref:Uncharacterized protein n=1 Tax=Handroanthus impetiginosus TaxID=429701 RepID=A0A2G9GSN0_9LAMI|nr:hypothetical protein CDL12_19100 [Handroanthus impetiginosus]
MAQIQTSNEGSTSHRRPPGGRKIQKVPELLLKEQNSQDYIPKVVSIGPYHHGKPELRLAESVKPETLKMVLWENEDSYYQVIKNNIKNNIIDIRNCYENNPIDSYKDDELVRIMLLDACFIMIYIEGSMPPLRPSDKEMIHQNASDMLETLGLLTMSTVLLDIFLLESQIPFWILKFVLRSRYNKEESRELLHRYVTRSVFGDFGAKTSSSPKNEELHLLEAFHRIVAFDFPHKPKKTCLSFINCRFFSCTRAKEKTSLDASISANRNIGPKSGESSRCISRFRSHMNKLKARACQRLVKKLNESDHAKDGSMHSFRSATDLKAKGILFKHVKFTSNWIYGKLQLPHWCVAIYTKVFFLNMTAYELSPNNPSQVVVTAYINLMKLLIVKPEDVKELREKKILLCKLGSDKQILKVYQDINTYGADNSSIFQEVKNGIEAHHISKAKIWMAELIHTYFRSPWTFITLLVAIVLLVLTLLQII